MSTVSSGSPAVPARVKGSLTSEEIEAILQHLTEQTMDALAVMAMERLMTVLEAEIPASLETPKNQKLERSLRRDIAAYFTALEQALPIEAIERLYYSLVVQEGP